MPKESELPILTAVELIARRSGQILLGLRAGDIAGAGTWALPGGHQEFGEGLADALRREMFEELGADISLKEAALAVVTDAIREDEGVHHLHATFEYWPGPDWEPQLMEPDRCAEWRWWHLDELPEAIFWSHQPILDRYLAGKLYAA